jgi:hypothetical protein
MIGDANRYPAEESAQREETAIVTAAWLEKAVYCIGITKFQTPVQELVP